MSIFWPTDTRKYCSRMAWCVCAPFLRALSVFSNWRIRSSKFRMFFLNTSANWRPTDCWSRDRCRRERAAVWIGQMFPGTVNTRSPSVLCAPAYDDRFSLQEGWWSMFKATSQSNMQEYTIICYTHSIDWLWRNNMGIPTYQCWFCALSTCAPCKCATFSTQFDNPNIWRDECDQDQQKRGIFRAVGVSRCLRIGRNSRWWSIWT